MPTTTHGGLPTKEQERGQGTVAQSLPHRDRPVSGRHQQAPALAGHPGPCRVQRWPGARVQPAAPHAARSQNPAARGREWPVTGNRPHVGGSSWFQALQQAPGVQS